MKTEYIRYQITIESFDAIKSRIIATAEEIIIAKIGLDFTKLIIL